MQFGIALETSSWAVREQLPIEDDQLTIQSDARAHQQRQKQRRRAAARTTDSAALSSAYKPANDAQEQRRQASAASPGAVARRDSAYVAHEQQQQQQQQQQQHKQQQQQLSPALQTQPSSSSNYSQEEQTTTTTTATATAATATATTTTGEAVVAGMTLPTSPTFKSANGNGSVAVRRAMAVEALALLNSGGGSSSGGNNSGSGMNGLGGSGTMRAGSEPIAPQLQKHRSTRPNSAILAPTSPSATAGQQAPPSAISSATLAAVRKAADHEAGSQGPRRASSERALRSTNSQTSSNRAPHRSPLPQQFRRAPSAAPAIRQQTLDENETVSTSAASSVAATPRLGTRSVRSKLSRGSVRRNNSVKRSSMAARKPARRESLFTMAASMLGGISESQSSTGDNTDSDSDDIGDDIGDDGDDIDDEYNEEHAGFGDSGNASGNVNVNGNASEFTPAGDSLHSSATAAGHEQFIAFGDSYRATVMQQQQQQQQQQRPLPRRRVRLRKFGNDIPMTDLSKVIHDPQASQLKNSYGLAMSQAFRGPATMTTTTTTTTTTAPTAPATTTSPYPSLSHQNVKNSPDTALPNMTSQPFPTLHDSIANGSTTAATSARSTAIRDDDDGWEDEIEGAVPLPRPSTVRPRGSAKFVPMELDETDAESKADAHAKQLREQHLEPPKRSLIGMALSPISTTIKHLRSLPSIVPRVVTGPVVRHHNAPVIHAPTDLASPAAQRQRLQQQASSSAARQRGVTVAADTGRDADSDSSVAMAAAIARRRAERLPSMSVSVSDPSVSGTPSNGSAAAMYPVLSVVSGRGSVIRNEAHRRHGSAAASATAASSPVLNARASEYNPFTSILSLVGAIPRRPSPAPVSTASQATSASASASQNTAPSSPIHVPPTVVEMRTIGRNNIALSGLLSSAEQATAEAHLQQRQNEELAKLTSAAAAPRNGYIRRQHSNSAVGSNTTGGVESGDKVSAVSPRIRLKHPPMPIDRALLAHIAKDSVSDAASISNGEANGSGGNSISMFPERLMSNYS